MVVPLSPLGAGSWTAWVATGAAAEAPKPAPATIPNIDMKRADRSANPSPNFLRNCVLFISQCDPFHIGRPSASLLQRYLFVTGLPTDVISKNLINIFRRARPLFSELGVSSRPHLPFPANARSAVRFTPVWRHRYCRREGDAPSTVATSNQVADQSARIRPGGRAVNRLVMRIKVPGSYRARQRRNRCPIAIQPECGGHRLRDRRALPNRRQMSHHRQNRARCPAR
jgi:hypothetical protein